MLPALYPGCRSAHVVALCSTTRLPLPGALGFLPYRGDLSVKFLVIMLPYLNSYKADMKEKVSRQEGTIMSKMLMPQLLP